ncbi:MAG: DUF1822 family protein [Stigonema ocellatum SAG 48.90 = DSM 106950]|nr:DUF1822 family protein [Stigonema ocellatum SAG 48.90 = DSM 106950]
MSNTLTALTSLNPDQIWVEVSLLQIEQAVASEQKYSYDVARSIALNNYLALDAFLNWLKIESGIDEQPKVWPSLDSLPSIWEFVNGTAIDLGNTRIVLIPSDEIDTQEFCVPAEWIDIPTWAGDYYLAVQVNTEDHWLRIWGYTTHQKLKQAGQYDKLSYTYSLEQDFLIEDLNIMWVARSQGGDRKVALSSLPRLSQVQAEGLLAQLSQKSHYSPRLKVDFEQWGALIENEKWRQHLYDQRTQPVLVHWSQRFENIFTLGWQAVEDVFAPSEIIPVLGSKNLEPEKDANQKAIASIISLLGPHHDELLRRQAAGVLGKIGVGNSQVSIALTELLHTAREEKTRWQAAMSLGKVDPNNPQAGCQKAKLVDLGMQLGGHSIALIMAVMPKSDNEIGILLQVQSSEVQKNLPPGLKLRLLSESDEIIKEIETRRDATGRGKDDCIQLAFGCSQGTRFGIKVTCNNASFTESIAT